MQTIALLEKLIQAIYQNPAVLSSLPWSEIGDCILTEFELRDYLFPQAQYQELCEDIKASISQFEIGAQFMSSQAAVSQLKCFQAMLQTLPEITFSDTANERRTFLEAYYRHHQGNTIIVLGDSHVNFFSGNELLTYEPIGHDINLCPQANDMPFTVLHLGPCLAYKSNVYGSTCQMREKTDYLIQHFIAPGATLLVCLGEIDLRMHVYKQANAQEKSFKEIIDDICNHYLEYLLSLKEKGFQVNVWAPISSQSDNHALDPNFPRTGSEIERNEATLYFGQLLKELCRKNAFGFYSIASDLIDDTLHTRDTYLCEDHCHLSQAAMELASSQIQAFLETNIVK